MSGFVRTYADPGASLQDTFDLAVVMPTILRPEIRDALHSVFAQDLRGRIQVLVGIDTGAADLSLLDKVCASRPRNCVVQVFYPGYSTSSRRGGLCPGGSGGVLRCILSYLANSPYVAYLDDDNWWRPDHLRLLRAALGQADWAYSLRWFVHPSSRRAVCVDQWESVGPGRGVFRERFGGFVDPNCLMLNKVTCEAALPQWNHPLQGDPIGMSEDRNVFAALCRLFRGAPTNEPSAFYKIDPKDGMHPLRLRLMGPAYDHAAQPDRESLAPSSFGISLVPSLQS
jgi:hypothetical protein